MSNPEIVKYLVLRTIGNFLVLVALFGVVATFGPALYYEIQFRVNQAQGVTYTVADSQPEKSGLGDLIGQGNNPTPVPPSKLGELKDSKEKILIPKDTNFGIVIPKIGANAKVIPNVDAGNSTEYLAALQHGVAHAKGSVFPGFSGNIYLFAHSTDNWWNVGRYNAIFYLLKDVSVGDDIVVFFENVRHNYVVYDSKIVDATDVSSLTKSQHGGKETLVLQTCWPPGTSWKRILVFAHPK